MGQGEFPDTTTGWYKRVFNLAWPVILSSLSVPLVGIVDTAVMGQLPDPRYMAAVAVGAVIFSSVFWVFGFLRMGTTGFVAQAFGRGDRTEISLALLRALGVALVLGVLLVLFQLPLGQAAFWLMGAGPEVTASAQEYYAVRVWSAPFTFVNYVVLGCLFGLQRMRAALFIQLTLNLSNVLLDIWFVMYWGMDTAGVAFASVIGEVLAAVVGLWLLRHLIVEAWHTPEASLKLLWKKIADPLALKVLVRVNSDLFVRTLMLTAAFFFFTSQGAQFGTVVLAANAILINLLQMIAYGLDGFAHAAEALVGGAYGAKNKKAFQQAVHSSTMMAVVMAAMISVIYWLGGGVMIRLMTDIPEVITVADTYFIWIIIAPLLAIWSYQLDGVFIGVTHTRDMRNTVVLATIVYIVLVLLTVPVWGNHALWGCMIFFLLLRGILLGVLYPKLAAMF
uniref:DNA-damage-inducible protein F n=1 Tax=uncultured Thiotrichaceae bacterium TaxID=298394 RepID=A0A6S6SBB4_9GAMM|nr:MAG: DNA-damage-inducible protein F [uncultured Thiotrichaceae bacterium]